MVMKPESKEIAVQAGIDATRCFASNQLSASLLAQNTLCRGLIPAVTAMLKSIDIDDQDFFLRREAHRAHTHKNTGNPSVVAGELSRKRTVSELSTRSRSSNNGTRSGSLSAREMDTILSQSHPEWNHEKQSFEQCDPWMIEYFEGASRTAFGFALSEKFAGLSYGELVLAIYRASGAVL